MADVIKWVSDAGKAIALSTFDYIKELNPTISAFGYAASDLKYAVSDTVGSLKDKASDEENIKKSTDFAVDIMRNLKEDLKNANFRGEDDFDDLDDFDFGFDDDTDGYNEDTSEADKNTKFTTDIMQSVAETSTRIISNTTAKSTQYIIKANTSNTKALMNTNIGIFEKVNGGLATINHNIINIDNFNRTVTASHYQNSVNYYVQSLDILKEMNSTLKEMASLQKDIYRPEKQESKSLTIDDIIDADGVINFGAIKDRVVEDYGDIAKMFLGGDMKSGMGDIKKHPLQFLTKTAVSKLFPKMLANAMQDFNTTLSGVASTLLMKANNSNNLGLRLVLSLLGLGDFGAKGSLNTGAYEKGPVPFDGMTRKSIVEVIPTYLSKIYSAISGIEESRYDYEKGQFISVGQLQTEFDKMRKDSAMSAASSAGIKEYFDRYMKSLNDVMNQKQLDQLKNDFEGIIVKNFKDENTFDYRKSVEEIMSEYEIQSAENAKIIKSMWESMPVRTKMGYAGNLYSSMKGYNRKLRELEDSGTTPLMSLYNNSLTGSDNTALIETVTNNQKPYQSHMMKYIEEIYNSVDVMKDVMIEGYSKKKNGKNIIRSVMDRRNGKIKSTIDVKVNSEAVAADSTEDSGEDEEPPLPSRDTTYYENIFKTANEANDEYDDKKIKHNDLKDSIEEGYAKATNKKERRKVLLDRAGDIAKHPVQFLSAILNIAEDKLYDLVYGKDKEGNSVIDTITTNIKETFQEAKTWLQDKIFKPLRKQLTKEKIHDNVQKFFGMFGIDFDSVTGDIRRYLFGTKEKGVRTEDGVLTNIFGKVKSQFGGIFDYIKKSFGGVFDFLGIKGIKNKSGEEKEATNNNIDDIINRLKKNREEREKNKESNDDGTGEVGQAAEGIKRVKKTGAIIASEGEYILPPDMNPYNIAERYEKENEARDKFIRTYGGNPQLFYSGGTVDGDNVDDKVQKWYDEGLSTDQIIEKLKGLKKQNKATKDDYDMPTLWMRMKDEINNTIETLKAFTKDAQGKVPKNDTTEQVKAITKDTVKNMKDYAPSMITGGIIGGGVSLLTGMIGGPLLGAAAGAGIGLLQKSDILQRTLFGEKLADGTRDGTGKLPQKLTRNLYKYLPSMLKASTVGGIIGLTPLIPGGPLGGILLGSAVGFAQKNEAIQDYLFGEFGVLGDDFKEKVQRALPKMGFGALAGLVAGPFGITTNILLGSALGFAADTELFKNTIFGEKDKDGNREGGLLSMIREGVIDPLKDFVKESTVGVRNWFKKDVMDPITRSIQPISKQVQIYLKGIFEFAIKKVKGFFGGESDGLFAKMIRQKFIDPIVGTTTSILKTVAKPVGFVASLPAKAIGAVGDHYRRQQVRRGQATYMTAAERLAYREEGNLNRGLLGDLHNDRFAEADQIIANMSVEELEQARQGFAFARNASTASKKEMNAASTKIGNTLTSMNNISLQAARTVQKFVKNGNVDKALEFINTLNITDDQRDKLLKVVEKEGKRYNDAKAAKEDVIGTREKMYTTLRDMGFKDIRLNNLKKYEDLLRAEQMARDPALDEENNKVNEEMEKQDKRHSEIMDVIREATAYLRIMSNPNKEQREQMYNDTVDEIQNRTNEGENETNVRRSIFDRINNQHRRIINETTNTEEENKQAEETTNTESTVQDIIDEAYNGFKNKDSKENYKNMLLERSRKTQELMTKWRNEGLTDEEIKKKHAEYIKQNPLKPTKMKDSEEEEPEATGVENESGQDTGEINTEENNNTRDKKRNVIWQFVDGLPLKYFRTKDGDIRPDTGHSDTKLNLFRINKNREATEESANTQKSILDKITGIPTMLGQLFSSGDGKDEKPGVLKGLFSKALKVGGIAIAIGALPYLGQLYDKTLGPWFEKMNINGDTIAEKLTTLGDKIGEKLRDIIFGDGKHQGLLPWFEDKALPWIEDTLLPKMVDYFVGGFDFLLSKVVPKAVELLLINLPDILMGVVRGIFGMGNGILTAFKKNTKSQNHGFKVIKGNKSVEINSNNSSVSSSVSNDWELAGTINSAATDFYNNVAALDGSDTEQETEEGNIAVESEKTISIGGAKSVGGYANGKVQEDMFNTKEERYNKADEIIDLNKSAKSTMDKNATIYATQNDDIVKEKVAPILDSIYKFDDGSEYTGAELLSSNEIIGYETDKDGNEYPVRGIDILSNPKAAKSILGIDISLSEKEKEENTNVPTATEKLLAKGTILDILHGGGKTGKAISKVGKFVSAIGKSRKGIIRKNILDYSGRAVDSLGNSVSKVTSKAGQNLSKLINDVGNVRAAEQFLGEKVSSTAEANDIMSYLNDRAIGYDEAGKAIFKQSTSETVENTINKNIADRLEYATTTHIDDLVEQGARTAASTADNVVEQGARVASNVAEEAVEQGTKKGLISRGISKAAGFIKSKLSKSTQQLIDKVKDKMYEKLVSFFSHNKVINLIQKAIGKYDKGVVDVITKFGTELATKIADKFGKKAGEQIAKIAGKLASWLTGPLKLILMITEFVSGFNNANSTLGLTDKYSCSGFWKVVAGLVNVLNDEFLMGLVPMDSVVDLVVSLAESHGLLEENEMFQKFLEDREASAEEVRKYNDEHGTNYENVVEYNDSKKLSTKVWNGIKGAAKTVISVPGKIFNAVTGRSKEENTEEVYTNQEAYDNQNVTVDYTEEMAGSGSGLKIKDKIAEISKKIKEKQSRDANSTITKFSYYTNKKEDTTTTSYTRKVNKEATKTSNSILDTVKEIPNKIMQKLINPMENWMDEMQEPIQELILDTFNKSFVSPMETLFSIFGKMITSISNSSVIKTLIGDPDKPSDTGILGESTGTTTSTKNTSLVSKLKNTVSKAWNGIKKLFGKGSELDGTFVSQMDPSYYKDSIGGMSVASQGCGPASATMAINETLSKFTGGYTNMDDQIGIANQYVANSGNGVTADYFGDTFARSGLNTNYYQNKSSILDSIRSGNSTVLLGQDSTNTSKEKSPFGPGNHYVVANGVSNDGNTIYINDPESNRSNIPYSTTKILGHTKLGITPELPSAGRSALRIHRKVPTKIYKVFYGGDSTGDYVGKYTKKFESGSLGSRATASCGNDGGASFGSYQFIYSNEIPRGFMKTYYPNIYNESQWKSSVANAKKQWLAAVDSDPNNFFKHEHEWAAKKYYDVTKSLLKGYFDPDTYARSIQDCIWSWSIHRGMYGAASDFKAACRNAGITNPQTCDEAKLLKVCYNYRNNWFTSRGYGSSKRYKDIQSEDSEYYVVKKLIGQKPINPYSVNGEVSSTGTAGTDGTTGDSTQRTFSSIFDLYNVLDDAFAKAFGFDTSTDSSTTTSADSTSSSGVVAKGQLSQKVIDLAVQERPNIKYIYGADNESTKTFDCSSFTKYIYKKAANINLNRKSVTQHASPGMKEIPFSQAQPGDVIEFNRPNTHVGLYLGGNKLLHNLNSNVDCVITEDLDSNGNRVRKNGTVNQYFYKAGTIKDQPVNTNTTGANTANLEVSKTEAGTESATNHVTHASALKMAAKGSGLVPKKFNKDRNIISTVIPKRYSGGESNIFDDFMNSYSYNTLNDKTKLQAIKSILKYLSGIDSNTSKLTSIVELLTKVISIITNMSNTTSGNSELIQTQKEQLASLVDSITKLASSANRSNNYESGDDYQLNMLIKNVNELIRE